MRAIRKHGFWGAIAAAALVLVMMGTDASPAATASTDAVVVRTRPLHAIPTADLPTENGVPVLPAWDGIPRSFVFETAEESVALIEAVEEIVLPGEVQRLVIPAIQLDTDVERQGIQQVDGDLRYQTAKFVVGQYGGSNPGEGENVVLAGHVGTRDGSAGNVFRDLQNVQMGDAIQIHTARGVREYVVQEIRHVGSEAVEVMQASGQEQVTLITCRLCNVDCERLVVVAVPREPDRAGEAPTA